ncbi:Hypothetical protein SRAE_2000172200 [Strongyloides ratti]|uniref:Uncharacterized protein n=1 Tax=Strongyloides ratti TaxID=34506 RepID=A0A090LBC5_STRRB|nr:Hypothetical protein SRAE_2000172200 [Strongyloides ratti]CEF67057.1 Hypothetical protein SRAE_2000172200 [Strongyloides ratti]
MKIFFTFFFLLLWVIQLKAQNYQIGDNNTISDCMSNCSVDSNGRTCLNKLLSFVENDIVSQIRRYVAVQINIDQFHRRHKKNYKSDWDNVKKNSTLIMKENLLKNDIISNNTISKIISILIDAVSGESNKIIIWTAHYSCPIECNQYNLSWRNVFISSIILNGGLIIGVFPLFLTILKRILNKNKHLK